MPIGSGAKGWPTGLFSHGMWLIWVLLPLVSACGRTVSPRKLSKWLPCNEVWLPTAAELSGGQTKRRMVAAALSSRSMQTSFFLCPSALLGPLLDTDRTLVKGHSYKIFLTSSFLWFQINLILANWWWISRWHQRCWDYNHQMVLPDIMPQMEFVLITVCKCVERER